MDWPKPSDHIKFHIGGTLHTVKTNDISPETSLNTYLRKNVFLTGTRRMCLEGGCGTCVVALEENDPVTNKRKFYAVNSCLVPIYSCNDKKIHTIEGIGGPIIKYHPIQKVLAENNGTQCGFCSPGMVMNMYSMYESGPVTKEQLENSFGGHICRCTGYRPILEGFRKLTTGEKDIEDYVPCYKRKDCKESCLQIQNEQKYSFALYFNNNGDEQKWMKVYFLKDILQLFRTMKDKSYMLVAGNTARGVYKPKTTPNIYIDITSVKELLGYDLDGDTLTLGANITLTQTIECFETVSKSNANFSYLQKIADHINLIAHNAVRNIGTIAGNLMTKHTHNEFPSDIFLILETANAILLILDYEENETYATPSQFLKISMNKKILKTITLHGLKSSYKYGSYKIMPRAQNAHAMVNAGFLFQFNGETVVKARIVYGGINPEFIHAEKTENILNNQKLFDNKLLQEVYKTLSDEVKPDYVLPDPTPTYRKELAISLFYKYVLSIAPDEKLSPRNKSGKTILTRPLSSARQEYGTNKDKYPLSQPIVKIEALAQTSGQAHYIDDFPDIPHQLYAAFVYAKASANSVITNVDIRKALEILGVVKYFDKNDIVGKNTFIVDMTLDEELFCSGKVKYYSQPVGLIVAETHEIAEQAADLVKITYSSGAKPLLDIPQLLKENATSKLKLWQTVPSTKKGNDVKKVIKGNYYKTGQYHFHMEVQCCSVVPVEDSFDRGLNIYASTQSVRITQIAAAQILNLNANKINVYVRRLGGGFGAKLTRSSILSTATSLAAYKLNRPVKMWMPLEQNMTVIGKRYPLYVDYELGCNSQGRIQYMNANLYSDYGTGGNEPNELTMVTGFQNSYDSCTWDMKLYRAQTDMHGNCFARAPGSLECLAAIEFIMDHIAFELNIDPIEVRNINILADKHAKVLDYIKDIKIWSNVDKRKKEMQDFNEKNRWKKKGFSVIPMTWVLDIHSTFSVLLCIYSNDGSVSVTHGGIECGQGINTKVAQVCAYKFDIPIEMVSVKPYSSNVTGNSTATGASITSEGVALAVIKCCDKILARMKPVKDKMTNPKWADVVKQCFQEYIQLSEYSKFSPRDLKKYEIYGVAYCEVEVDILTGQHEIVKMDIIEDVGDSMSPLIDIGQAEGAVVMGIGYFTTEELIYDDQRILRTNRTWNYKPPGAKDIPIEFRIKFPKNNPHPLGVLKSKAIGEPPICLTVSLPLAIRNAVASARADSDPKMPKFYFMDRISNVENTFLNSLNDYKQYTL